MKRAFLIAAALITIVAVVFVSTLVIHSIVPNQPLGEIRYIDLISVVLTALSIMITVLGLFIAVLGVIGWATFESKLRDSSISYFTAQLAKDGPLRKEIEQLLVDVSLRGVDGTSEQSKNAAVVAAPDETIYDD
ncbi:hypothetical protein KZX46_14270 [Polymorphobacter sp. PAMC 29334]|uniref:hypothetical protein n=1 Tax=Polymorphobacter sp. PAMC 29334 TaxID=2862331 RepID=UPI001C76CD36|nr:hypothetical protein [Polymorphobacter sp. PAMC 29334]QYE33980.1 hypothetical protein KZX46_14270 [Polymorphobacter sp. PAMC 29334]